MEFLTEHINFLVGSQKIRGREYHQGFGGVQCIRGIPSVHWEISSVHYGDIIRGLLACSVHMGDIISALGISQQCIGGGGG